MSFDRLHKLVTYVYASLGLFVVAATADVPVALQLLASVLVVLSWYAEGVFISTPRYQRAHTIALVAVVALEGLSVLSGASIFTALVELTMALSVSRLAQRRSAAEHQQIAALALVHLLVGTVVDTGLVYAFVFFGFLVATPWMMALTHLRGEIERKYGATSAEAAGVVNSEAIARVRTALRSRELATPRFLLGSAALALPLFIVTAAFFLIFPRVGSGFLDVRANEGERVAGFGSEIALGGFGTIRDDPTVVVRVFPPDLPAEPPSSRTFRLRGTSFDTYDGTRWRHGAVRERALPIEYGFHVLVRQPDPDRDPYVRIQAEPLDGPIAFLLEDTVAVRFTQGGQIGRVAPPDALLTNAFELRLRDVEVPSVIYEAVVSHRGEAIDTLLDDDTRRHTLAIPEGHERVVALARTLTAGAKSDAERVAILTRYLRDSGRFRYSLTITPTGDVPPLVHFLFTGRAGHCEYFATALAIMLRGVGIPSRNVTGFLGGTFNPFGGFYGVRQGDAHSWVEAYVDGAFRVYDPTPRSREDFAQQAGAFDVVRAAIDALRARWATHVVGFDLDRQMAFFRSMRSAFRSNDARDRGEASSLADASPRSASRIPTARVLLALAVLAAIVYAVRWYRGRPAPPPAIVALYAVLDRALARRGHARPPSRSPRAHLALLEAEAFDDVAVVREITEAYARARYADAPLPDRATVARLRKEAKRLSRRR